MPSPRERPEVQDLRELVRVGVARGGALLTAGELALAARILTLEGDAAHLYARLSARVPPAFCVRVLTVPGLLDVAAAVDGLVRADLADRLVPWSVRARLVPLRLLRELCRAGGLPVSGRRSELIDRLGRSADLGTGWFRLAGRGLLARLARFTFQHPFPDRSTPVIERLGLVRWAAYDLTAGPGLHRDRTALLAWEALLSPRDLDHVLDGLAAGAAQAPGDLDLRRVLRRVVREAAEGAEKARHPDAAAALYTRLVDAGERPGRVAFRRARAEEARGRPQEALAVLRGALPHTLPSEVPAVVRCGRRLARRLRTSFVPAPPRRPPAVRDVRLDPELPGHRPRWATPAGPRTVEAAVVAWLASHGRIALHVEGRLSSTLCALLLADLYFLPVPGALPVRRLAGPLDLGTPAFRRARAAAWDDRMSAVAAGRAPEIVADADTRWRGVRLAGARWDRADRDALVGAAAGYGPRALTLLLEHFADGGPRAMGGFPDLVVLPGAPVRLADAFPSRLPAGLVLAEVKGPGDAVRDAQLVWADQLAAAGAQVELWKVGPR